MKIKSYMHLLFALLAFLVFTDNSLAQQPADISKEVISAISKGNARDISKHFGTTVDLKFPGNEGTFSRNQAELIVRNFFSRNAPSSFNVQHQGPSRDGSLYVIGNYRSTNGQSFRVYFLIKKISDKNVLHLLQFERQ